MPNKRINRKARKKISNVTFIVFTDASQTGFGGFVAEIEEPELVASWLDIEAIKSSIWRE